MSEDALRQLLPVISSPLFLMPFIPLAVLVVSLALVSGARKVERLADRLRRLCESTGRPEIRTLRPRRLGVSLEDLRSLERTLLSLERDQGIPGRRVPGDRSKSLMRDMEKRISRLEERGLR